MMKPGYPRTSTIIVINKRRWLVRELRIPKGWVVYDTSIIEWNRVGECLKKIKNTAPTVIVFHEPIYFLGSLVRNGEFVFWRKYVVAGKGSIAVEKDVCKMDHIIIELDAWGEAEKASLHDFGNSIFNNYFSVNDNVG